jgi:hypothetical protein
MTKKAYNRNDGLQRSLALMRACAIPQGFLASPIDKDNYRRVFSRDSVVMGIASLLAKDEELIGVFRESLRTLCCFRGEHGEIPSNVDVDRKEVSYGSTVGRVDATIWFLVGLSEYLLRYDDPLFFSEMRESIKSSLFLLGAWEFNGKGFLYVPPGGDWADEFSQHGYVLYDEVLYFQALKGVYGVLKKYDSEAPLDCLKKKICRLKHLIFVNFWFHGKNYKNSPYVYHPVLYSRVGENYFKDRDHFFASFSPEGYSFRFDSWGNLLAILTDIACPSQTREILMYFQEMLLLRRTYLIPAFHPIVEASQFDWQKLQMNFSYSYKNKPFEYHNGGLWPVITGFYIATLAKLGKRSRAEKFLDALHIANSRGQKEDWEFREFHHGKTKTPLGAKFQGWSAAGAVIAHFCLEGSTLFVGDGPKIVFDPFHNKCI